MSPENVELSLVALDAYNRRDAEALIALSDPDVVWSAAFERETEGGTYRGHAGVREGIRALAEFSEESHAEFSEWHDFGDRVLGLGDSALDSPVASSSIRRRRPFTRGATESSLKCGAGSATPKPSKPPGCRSRHRVYRRPRLQRVQAGRRLLSSSLPPSAIGVRWSTSVAGAPQWTQARPYRAKTCRLIACHRLPRGRRSRQAGQRLSEVRRPQPRQGFRAIRAASPARAGSPAGRAPSSARSRRPRWSFGPVPRSSSRGASGGRSHWRRVGAARGRPAAPASV
jgi:SnoaL-like domain